MLGRAGRPTLGLIFRVPLTCAPGGSALPLGQLEYGIEKSKVVSIRSKLFGALRESYQERDRLRLFVQFRGVAHAPSLVVFSALAENGRLKCETGSLVMRATHAARARHGTREGACAPPAPCGP